MRDCLLRHGELLALSGKEVGLYVNCFPGGALPFLHIHVVDLATVTPAFQSNARWNLPLQDALEVILRWQKT